MPHEHEETAQAACADVARSARARTIRSFVRRAGRTTAAQRRALATLYTRYGLPASRALDAAAVFGRVAPLTVEIGFGNGDALLALAGERPERDFIGIEVYDAGVGRVLEALASRGLTNVRVVHGDALPALAQMFTDAALDEVLLFFPDPWPKKRHHKRRIVQPSLADLLCRKLHPGGTLRLATDWLPYAQHMLAVLEAHPCFANAHGAGGRAPRPAERPLTRFERRGERLGHPVVDLEFRRR